MDRLRKDYIFRVAERFGIVKVSGWKYKFFFEGGAPAEEKKESSLADIIHQRIEICKNDIEHYKNTTDSEWITLYRQGQIFAYEEILKDMENDLETENKDE